MAKDEAPGAQNEANANLGLQFKGQGFMDYDQLVNIVKAYQQRHFCEDVEAVKKAGGKQNLTC